MDVIGQESANREKGQIVKMFGFVDYTSLSKLLTSATDSMQINEYGCVLIKRHLKNRWQTG